MLTEDLTELIEKVIATGAESQNIEVKSAHGGCPRRLYDTLSAFANQDNGGCILFGLDEEKEFLPVGVYDLQDLQKQVTEQCNQMEPPVRAVFTSVLYEDCVICSAEIPALDVSERPCYYAGVGRIKGSYVRVGDADLPMTDYEIYSYEAFRKHLHDDERPIERAEYSLLDTGKIEHYIAGMKAERPGFNRLSDEQVHEMLSISRRGVPTLAAVLNFGIYPQGYLQQLAVTAVVVPGNKLGDTTEDGARFIDNRRIDGTLQEMLEGTMAFAMRNMKIATVISSTTGGREDRPEYPVKAVREAVLNALIHRDYSVHTEGTPVQLYFFRNRLEIHSPGNLYGRMTVEALGHAKPDLRNPVLASMAELLLNTENRYSGIPTMRREMEKAGLPAPVFENRRNEFVVTFYNGSAHEETSETLSDSEEKELLRFCETPRTRKEIADHFGVQTIFYAMKKLVQPMVLKGSISLTIPEKPKSKKQKYYTSKR